MCVCVFFLPKKCPIYCCVLTKTETRLTVYGFYREYGLGADHEKEAMLKQRVQFIFIHMYDRSQKVIESLERLNLLMSVMFAFPNQMLLPIIRCP